MPADTRDHSSVPDIIKNLITLEDIRMVVQRATNDSTIEALEYTQKSYSKEKLGLLGYHQHLQVILQRPNSNESETLNFFVKSVPYNAPHQKEFVEEEGIFEEEKIFYEKIFPLLTENYDGEKWSPKCYLIKNDLLLMEDLRCQSYKLRGRFFDDTSSMKALLAAVAKFHACAILAESKLNRSVLNRVTLKEYFPSSFREKQFNPNGRAASWYNATLDIACAIAKRLGQDTQKFRDTVNRIYELVRPSEKHRNVICHGDLWTNNIMFDDTQPIPKCVLVDFQIVRYAPQVLDVLQALYLNTSREFRTKHQKELIAYYYSVFEKNVKNCEIIGDAEIPTLDDIFYSFGDLKLFGPIIAVYYYPTSLMDVNEISTSPQDDDSVFELIQNDRTTLTLNHMEKDAFFKNRIEEVISEIAEFDEK